MIMTGIMNGGSRKEISLLPVSVDPEDPPVGACVFWVSDGTDSGDAGDIMVKITVGETTKTVTLVDFSEA